jgi:chemotaxis protein methyltransferase CheR
MAFTFFFRDRQTLDLIQEYVVPIMKSRRFIRIWDAGCAYGPEPYSLAILIREKMGPFLFRNVNILASDLNNNFGKIINEGVYSKDEVGRIPENILNTYFSPVQDKSGYFTISDEMRKSVEFFNHDLTSLKSPRTGFCLIVCKNVLLHLKAEDQVKVIQMFYDSLEQDGYFVTEQTQKLPDELSSKFERVVSNAQLFRKI